MQPRFRLLRATQTNLNGYYSNTNKAIVFITPPLRFWCCVHWEFRRAWLSASPRAKALPPETTLARMKVLRPPHTLYSRRTHMPGLRFISLALGGWNLNLPGIRIRSAALSPHRTQVLSLHRTLACWVKNFCLQSKKIFP